MARLQESSLTIVLLSLMMGRARCLSVVHVNAKTELGHGDRKMVDEKLNTGADSTLLTPMPHVELNGVTAHAKFGTTLEMHLGHDDHEHPGTFRTDFVRNGAQLPLNKAQLIEQEWEQGEQCDQLLGYPWASKDGVTRRAPLTIYTTVGGQISGIGMRFMDEIKKKVFDAGFFRTLGNPTTITETAVTVTSGAQLDVAFRGYPCSDTTPADPNGLGSTGLGDRIVVAPYGANYSIPLVGPHGYRGSCFHGHGWHHFVDLTWTPETFGKAMTWRAENIMPVVSMYDDAGNINAIFFASTALQQNLFPPRRQMWDQIPLPQNMILPLMCKNFCDADCHFEDTWGYSSAHIFFNDKTNGPAATCKPELKCFLKVLGVACCPQKLADVPAAIRTMDEQKCLEKETES